MIYAVTVTNNADESIRLELANPYETGIAIIDIGGIGQEGADINVSEIATIDGGIFNFARRSTRTITFTFLLLWANTVEESRHRVYKYFPIKKKVHLLFETEERLLEIEGYVETNSAGIFSQEETQTVSVVCPDPNFYGVGEETELFTGVQPWFEFPFSNESLTRPLIEFGHVMADTTATFHYNGEIDTGMIITIHGLTGGAEYITLWNNKTSERIIIDTTRLAQIAGYNFDYGDDIVISTMPGNKYATFWRKGVDYNIIGAINKDADWFKISNGENVFTFTAVKGEEHIIVTFKYRTAYGGV